ncbi:MAG: class II aldolase/adducin family protein [Alphaproteobacteria bacterium]|nr:class II aldolase/adducin family protein [Alphaproteobacteria bacterium]
MSTLSDARLHLVAANRILAHEGVVDGFGHVSIRHPEQRQRFILSRSRAAELVTIDDLMVFEPDGTPVDPRGHALYAERFIHAGVYEARPDVGAVIHNHAPAIIPFSVTGVAIRPILHMAGAIGEKPPVWDIRDKFGDTDMLVVTMEQARDLARTLGGGTVALMRGHGCVVAAPGIREAVMTAIYLAANAALQMAALRLGEPRYLTPGEVALTATKHSAGLGLDRAWEYWCRRAGASDRTSGSPRIDPSVGEP